MCQRQFIDEIGRNNTWLNEKRQYSVRKLRYYKRKIMRRIPVMNSAAKILQINHDQIQTGDLVNIRSKSEIKRTLNKLNQTRGCTFLPEMYRYCGREFRVFKQVDHFFDDSKQKLCKCNNIFLLEGSYCTGSCTYLKRCDLNCFFFWQIGWLEKV